MFMQQNEDKFLIVFIKMSRFELPIRPMDHENRKWGYLILLEWNFGREYLYLHNVRCDITEFVCQDDLLEIWLGNTTCYFYPFTAVACPR